MEKSFIHVNLPSQTTDAIQRLLARAIEWREEQELAEIAASGISASGREELSPAEALRGTRSVVVVLPGEEESISYSQSSTEA